MFANKTDPLQPCTVFFDRPLLNTPQTPTNWFLRYGNRRYVLNSVTVQAPDRVQLVGVAGAFNIGPDVCSYFRDPPELFGSTGVPVAQFLNFLLNVA